MITNEELDIAIENFAKTISKQILGLVYHRPTPEAKATNCISNVLSFIERNGGGIKFGWTFHHRISPEFGDYLFSTHHAVWHNPNGNLIDITPFNNDPKHHPKTVNGSILFLLDDNAKPIKVENYLIPLPLKYYAIYKNEKLEHYVKSLRDKELKYYKVNFGISINK